MALTDEDSNSIMDANDNFDNVADAAVNLSLGCHLVVFLDM